MLPETSPVALSFDITAQLDRWRSGDLLARDALIDHFYPVRRAMPVAFGRECRDPQAG